MFFVSLFGGQQPHCDDCYAQDAYPGSQVLHDKIFLYELYDIIFDAYKYSI